MLNWSLDIEKIRPPEFGEASGEELDISSTEWPDRRKLNRE